MNSLFSLVIFCAVQASAPLNATPPDRTSQNPDITLQTKTSRPKGLFERRCGRLCKTGLGVVAFGQVFPAAPGLMFGLGGVAVIFGGNIGSNLLLAMEMFAVSAGSLVPILGPLEMIFIHPLQGVAPNSWQVNEQVETAIWLSIAGVQAAGLLMTGIGLMVGGDDAPDSGIRIGVLPTSSGATLALTGTF